MTNEAYCSFEVSKLLKKKGFEGECPAYYRVFPSKRIAAICYSRELRQISEDDPNEILCPTHQVACAWLREVHKIYIVISPVSGKGYGAILCDVGDFDDFDYIGETDYLFHPEEAVEAALKYTLENLI